MQGLRPPRILGTRSLPVVDFSWGAPRFVHAPGKWKQPPTQREPRRGTLLRRGTHSRNRMEDFASSAVAARSPSIDLPFGALRVDLTCLDRRTLLHGEP